MDSNKDYSITQISSDEVIRRLQGCSPLQASKVLLEVELHDQRDTLEVLHQIELEMRNSQSGIGESLIQPIILSVCDGFVSHPKLNLSKNGLTASRLANEIQHFSYNAKSCMSDDVRIEKVRLDEHSSKQVDDKGEYNRHELEDRRKLYTYRDAQMGENRKIYSELEINEQGQRRTLYKQSDQHNQAKRERGSNFTQSSIDVDHQVPLKKIFDEYGVSKGITLDDLKEAANQDGNLKNISAQLNRSKGDKSWTQYSDDVTTKRRALEEKKIQAGYLSQIEEAELRSLPSEQTLKNALAAETAATTAIESDLNKSVVKNFTKDNQLAKELGSEAYGQAKDELKQKGIGELIILIVKPIFFELSDSLKNGVTNGFDTLSKIDAIGLRFKRAYNYILDNIKHIGMDVIKDAIKNFIKYFINAIVNLFVGILKKALKIISEGFSAIVQSIKILMSDSSPSQKAEAISKLLATTIVTYISFAFEETIAPYVEMIPVIGEYLKDATGIMVSGIGSTMVVWLIDQADVFSNKAELRTKRIKEIFELRIQQIKENTDAFEHAAIEKLANDKLQFRQLSEKLVAAIAGNRDVNKEVSDIAEFMQVDLKIKSNNDFLALLEESKTLEIA